jgi:16S rRNA (cytosine1402-N4)-methyltransferase
MTTFEHNPVMVDEITAIFDAVPAGTIIDATLGGGGHSHALLKRRPDINILGIDQDADAIAAALERLPTGFVRAVVASTNSTKP